MVNTGLPRARHVCAASSAVCKQNNPQKCLCEESVPRSGVEQQFEPNRQPAANYSWKVSPDLQKYISLLTANLYIFKNNY